LAERADVQALVLRAFELLLLRDVGFLSDLAHEGSSLSPLDPQALYVLAPGSGLRLAHDDDAHSLSGAHWLDLHTATQSDEALLATMRACAPVLSALRHQLRAVLHYHCGVRVFQTRQLMLDIQAMRRMPEAEGAPTTPL
jgi:DNA repair protein RecO (recombination protein O)